MTRNIVTGSPTVAEADLSHLIGVDSVTGNVGRFDWSSASWVAAVNAMQTGIAVNGDLATVEAALIAAGIMVRGTQSNVPPTLTDPYSSFPATANLNDDSGNNRNWSAVDPDIVYSASGASLLRSLGAMGSDNGVAGAVLPPIDADWTHCYRITISDFVGATTGGDGDPAPLSKGAFGADGFVQIFTFGTGADATTAVAQFQVNNYGGSALTVDLDPLKRDDFETAQGTTLHIAVQYRHSDGFARIFIDGVEEQAWASIGQLTENSRVGVLATGWQGAGLTADWETTITDIKTYDSLIDASEIATLAAS